MPESPDSVNASSSPSSPELSKFGKTLGQHTGIGELMDDLGAALANKPADLCMLGGGQPAYVPEMVELFQKRLQELAADKDLVHQTLGEYDPADGNFSFRESIAEMMNTLYRWTVAAENIGLSSGSQSSCFHLMNALADEGQQVMLPLLPDYMGYRDQLVSGASFLGINGLIKREGDTFKYALDREKITAAPDSVKLMVLSRPANPSGNVVSDEELHFLSDECARRQIPLIVDHAYGEPFPNAMYVSTKPFWKPHHIHLYSFSKLGLPGTRTSIIIAAPPIIELMRNMTAVTSLANPNLGQALLLPMIKDASLTEKTKNILLPFYLKKRDHAIAELKKHLADKVDYALHAPEGAFFLWVWFPQLPLTSSELVEALKKEGVLAISGHWFFYGSNEQSPHHRQCLRITYTMDSAEVEKGIERLANCVEALHRETPVS